MTTKLHRPAAVIQPLPDPPEKRDMQQDRHYVPARYVLEAHYDSRGDVLVAGHGYLIASRGSVSDWKDHFYPDMVVAFGVDPEAIVDRNGYVISEVGKPPDFVLEFASETTAPRDVTVKRAGYAALGVSEFWRFDGSGKGYYPQPLAGDLLAGDRYEPVELTEEPDGEMRGYSPALSLHLCADAERGLRFRDPATGEYLRTHREALSETARTRAALADAEKRAAKLEAENARLRERSR